MIFFYVSLLAATASAYTKVLGTLNGISINSDGSIWGVNKANQTWYCDNLKLCNFKSSPGKWTQHDTSLSTISSYDYGVCGVTAAKRIKCMHKINGQFTNIWIELPLDNWSDVSVGNGGVTVLGTVPGNGGIKIFGIRNGELYLIETKAKSFTFNQPVKVANAPINLVKVSVGQSGYYPCVLNKSKRIYCRHHDQTWRLLSGSYDDISLVGNIYFSGSTFVRDERSLYVVSRGYNGYFNFKGSSVSACFKIDYCVGKNSVWTVMGNEYYRNGIILSKIASSVYGQRVVLSADWSIYSDS